VLQVVETLEVGGMERMVATLCRTLDPAVYDARVLVTKLRGSLSAGLVADGIPVDFAGVRFSPPDYFAWRRLVPFMRRFRPHVVHSHATHGLLFGGAAAALIRAPRMVHTEHGRVFPDKPHLMLAERWMARRLVKYVAVSDALAAAVHEHERIPRARIEVIPNGVADLPPADDAQVSALRTALLGSRSGPVVGATARLVWEKGLDVLLHAWARRQQADDAQGTLVIAGEGPERGNLEQLASSLGIAGSVVLPGTVTDVASFYRMLDVFVLSSVSEGLPMALLEAMAAGLPIVATLVGGVPDALNHGEAGVLVPVSDSASLSDALESLLVEYRRADTAPGASWAATSRAALLGKAARNRFEDAFTAQAMTARYARLYAPAPRRG
jgi:glycosyltransferase involved in cell wall biosynthesis